MVAAESDGRLRGIFIDLQLSAPGYVCKFGKKELTIRQRRKSDA